MCAKCVKTHTFASCTGLLVCGSLFTQLTWRVTEVIRLSQLNLQKDLLKPQKDSSSLDLHSAHSIPCPPITMTFSALPSGSYQVDKVELNTDFDFCKSKCPTGWDAFDFWCYLLAIFHCISSTLVEPHLGVSDYSNVWTCHDLSGDAKSAKSPA